MCPAYAGIWRSWLNRPLLNRIRTYRMEVFDLYFASVVAMTIHPGFNKPDTHKPTLNELAELAAQMIEVREKWLSSQQQ